MLQNLFLSAEDVQKELGISRSFAYRIIRDLNDELEKMGYYTIAARVNREYFYKRFCYHSEEKIDQTRRA